MASGFFAILDDLREAGLLRVEIFPGRWMNLNVAIAEVRIPTPQGGYVIRYIPQIQGRGIHSEPLLLDRLARMGIRPDQVTRFFTSGGPCPACNTLVRELLPHLRVLYSYPL